MKILFLRPNSGIPVAPPPIGLMYLVGYLRKARPGKDQITVLDGRSELPSEDQVFETVKRVQPDLVGVTSFTMENRTAHRYVELAKQYRKDCATVIGGPYGTSDAAEALNDPNLDFSVRGEGEATLTGLLDALDTGASVASLNGLAYRNNGTVVAGTFADLIEDINEIPYPAWDAINLESYFIPGKVRRLTNPIQANLRGMSIFSTRGCPYQCTYCHNLFGKRLRKRSVENVLGEIRWLIEDFKVEEIEFIDDVFNLDRPRAKAICDGIINAGWKLGLSFPNGLRADQMDEELVDKMKQAGAYRINYAVESGTLRVQKMIKKNLNLERAHEIIDYTADKGISTGGFFMIGFRDETEDEVWNTINFALKTKLHTASFFILTPFPNTPMYEEALALGYDMTAIYSDYGAVSANLSKVSNQKLEQLRKIAFRKFYFNLRRIGSIFRTTPNKWVLFKNFLRTARITFLGKEF
ncbi:MAG: radical SAM protein [bacterium]|nr:radical SAM protein [bacterium]